MQWDLGIQGLALLLLMSLGFGISAQAGVGRGAPGWVWLAGTAGFFASGLLISEVWFGWATAEELQPNIDGLSFDETLLGLIPGIGAIVAGRRALRRRVPAATAAVDAAERVEAGAVPRG